MDRAWTIMNSNCYRKYILTFVFCFFFCFFFVLFVCVCVCVCVSILLLLLLFTDPGCLVKLILFFFFFKLCFVLFCFSFFWTCQPFKKKKKRHEWSVKKTELIEQFLNNIHALEKEKWQVKLNIIQIKCSNIKTYNEETQII